jgi:hypothetical protein
MNIKKLSALCLALATSGAWATLVPASHTFGALPVATFGGSGIPNTDVAITTLNPTAGTVTLGLTATPRFANPALGNDGVGRFFAQQGVDATSAGSIAAQLAQWNFGFYVGGDAAALAQYTFQLLFDVDASSGESFLAVPLAGAAQDSWNLGFDSFEAAGGYSFNPNTAGEYSFKLNAFDSAGALADSSFIVVQVGNVPEPTTIVLVGLALAGMTVALRSRKG